MSLSLEHVSFGYSETPVLTDVSLALRRGDFLGLLGPNGSGKSTLLKLLAGILRPQAGTIRLRDVTLSSLRRREIARAIAYVPQESNWIFPFTVREVVSMGRVPFVSGMGYGSLEDEAIVVESMRQVDIAHLADKPVTAISGGERQRTLLARALAQKPEILLLDEPNAHLDLTHQVAIFEILRWQNEERAVTIVCVSHDLNLAALFCRSAALLSRASGTDPSGNSIVASGPVGDVFKSTLLEAVFAAPLTIDRHPLVEVPRVTLSPLRPHRETPPGGWNNHYEDH
jgi:iron complex transport system ATP-binding protein